MREIAEFSAARDANLILNIICDSVHHPIVSGRRFVKGFFAKGFLSLLTIENDAATELSTDFIAANQPDCSVYDRFGRILPMQTVLGVQVCESVL